MALAATTTPNHKIDANTTIRGRVPAVINHANTDEADEAAATAGASATAEPSLTADGPATTGDPRWPRDLLLRMRAAALRSNASSERHDWLPKSIINDI